MPTEAAMASRWQRIRLLMALSALLILAVAGVALAQGLRLSERLQEASNAVGVVDDLRKYLRLLIDLETGQRGYLLTGDAAYLAPYFDAENRLPELEKLLIGSLGSDPGASQKFKEIVAERLRKRSESDHSIRLYQESGSAAAADYIRRDRGKILMESLRAQLSELITDKEREARRMRSDASDLVAQRNWTLLVIALLGLIAGGGGYWLVRVHVRQLAKASVLRARAEESDRTSREKSLFLANMGHEIRTPMNAIFGFTQLLEAVVEGEKPRFYVQAIRQSGESLLALINDILDLSRIESGKLRVEFAATDLRDVLSQLQMMFAQMATDRGLKLTFVVSDQLPDALWLDPDRLRQLLINVIANSLKYTQAGSVTVSVHAEPAADGDETHVHCWITVEDTGVGIAPEDLTRAFEPFVQVGEAAVAERSGTGLGLSIVQKLTDLMSGEIAMTSTLGVGTQVRVDFAKVKRCLAAPRGEQSEGRLADLAPLNIVAVDDVELNRQLLEGMFAETPHQLSLAADGAEGVSLVQRLQPDLVLMDIRMPGMDGVEALARIRADPDLKSTRVVALTASAMLGEESAQRKKFDGYLRKPLTQQALFLELQRLFPNVASESELTDEIAPVAPAVVSVAERPLLASWLAAVMPTLDLAESTLSSSALDRLRVALELGGDWAESVRLSVLRQQLEHSSTLFDVDAVALQLAELRKLLNALSQELEAAPSSENDA